MSFAGRSISLLWILISNLSNVAVPSPHGDFLVVIFNFLVGSGTGPRIIIPALLDISCIVVQILLSIPISVLFSFTLTLGIVIGFKISLKRLSSRTFLNKGSYLFLTEAKMIESNFVNISLIILFAWGISAVMRILRQPLVIGYILTGIFVGPYFLDLISSSSSFNTFAQLGVALLLFTVGLQLNPRVIKEVGKASLITGIGQVVFTSTIGFLIAFFLGFSVTSSIYIAIALTFSSTIIIMKLLTDKGDLDSVYGKIAIGFLIVQDLIAIFALMFISSISTGDSTMALIATTFAKGIIAVVVLSFFGVYILPYFMNRIAKSQEFLFLFSLAWCLALASLFYFLNFSLEIGALFAGILLAFSHYSSEISSKLKPIWDFFIILFFTVIGYQMIFVDIQYIIIPICFF